MNRPASFMVGLGGLSLAVAAAPAEAQVRRFDFTAGTASSGWELPDWGAPYEATKGFGFEVPVPGDLAAFSVSVPEGDYRVIVTPRHQAPLTVWAEAHRLMTEEAAGPVTFTVNVRRPDLAQPPANAPGGNRVRLGAHEDGSYNWDDRLTLFINDRVATVEIEPANVRRLILMGDSTVADQTDGDYASWGQMLPRFMSRDVSVANHAHSGETLKSFLSSLRLDKSLEQMREGDLALIQFGHNDSKTQWPQTYAEAKTTFKAYLLAFVAEVERRGALPILVTSPHRRSFDATGRIRNTHGDYPDVVRTIAREQELPLIDLHQISADLYEGLQPADAPRAFADQGRDATHHNAYGAYILAWAVARALGEVQITADLVDPHSPTRQHEHPPSVQTFTLESIAGLGSASPEDR